MDKRWWTPPWITRVDPVYRGGGVQGDMRFVRVPDTGPFQRFCDGVSCIQVGFRLVGLNEPVFDGDLPGFKNYDYCIEPKRESTV